MSFRRPKAKIISRYDEDSGDEKIDDRKKVDKTKVNSKSMYRNKPADPRIHLTLESTRKKVNLNFLENEEVEESEPTKFQLKRSALRNQAISTKPTLSQALPTSNPIYTEAYLEELKSSTPVVEVRNQRPNQDPTDLEPPQDNDLPHDSAIDARPTASEEFIALEEDRVGAEPEIFGYDIEEGAGFEDEDLALGQRSQDLQDFRRRTRIEEAIRDSTQLSTDESDNSQDDDHGWEAYQLSKGAIGRPPVLQTHLPQSSQSLNKVVIPKIQPLPSMDMTIHRLRKILTDLEHNRQESSDKINSLSDDLLNLEQEQTQIQSDLDILSKRYSSVLISNEDE